MNFTEFKKQLFADLWEVFTENYYVNEDDAPEAINVKNKINCLIDSVQVVEDTISEEETEQLIDSHVKFIYRRNDDNYTQDDLAFIGELLWFDLVNWVNNDRYWFTREKGSVYDENVEGSL